METSEQLYKSRLASFKSVIKAISINQRNQKTAWRGAQRRVSIEIHQPLISAEKRIDYFSLTEVDRERMHDIMTNYTYDKIDVSVFLVSFTAREIHYAYALCRGRTYDEIEHKVTQGNEINMMKVNCIIILMMGAINIFAGGRSAVLVSDTKLKFIQDSLTGRGYVSSWELIGWEKKVKGMIEL